MCKSVDKSVCMLYSSNNNNNNMNYKGT